MTTLESVLSAMVALGALPWVPTAVRRIAALVTKRGLAHIAAEEREYTAKTAELTRALLRADNAEVHRERERDAYEAAMAIERDRCDKEKEALRSRLLDALEQLSHAALEMQRATMVSEQLLRMRDDARAELLAGARDVDVARRVLATVLRTEEDL